MQEQVVAGRVAVWVRNSASEAVGRKGQRCAPRLGPWPPAAARPGCSPSNGP